MPSKLLAHKVIDHICVQQWNAHIGTMQASHMDDWARDVSQIDAEELAGMNVF